jgi:hypothetical protein
VLKGLICLALQVLLAAVSSNCCRCPQLADLGLEDQSGYDAAEQQQYADDLVARVQGEPTEDDVQVQTAPTTTNTTHMEPSANSPTITQGNTTSDANQAAVIRVVTEPSQASDHIAVIQVVNVSSTNNNKTQQARNFVVKTTDPDFTAKILTKDHDVQLDHIINAAESYHAQSSVASWGLDRLDQVGNCPG